MRWGPRAVQRGFGTFGRGGRMVFAKGPPAEPGRVTRQTLCRRGKEESFWKWEQHEKQSNTGMQASLPAMQDLAHCSKDLRHHWKMRESLKCFGSFFQGPAWGRPKLVIPKLQVGGGVDFALQETFGNAWSIFGCHTLGSCGQVFCG